MPPPDSKDELRLSVAAESGVADSVVHESLSIKDFVESFGARQSHSTLNSIQEELVCSVCLELFDDPVCLNCGHSICYKCANRIAAYARACRTLHSDDIDYKARGSAEAARRKAPVELLVDDAEKLADLKKEVDTATVLESLKDTQKEPPPEVTCPLCRKRTLLGEVRPNAALREMVTSLRMRDATSSFTKEMLQERNQLLHEQSIL